MIKIAPSILSGDFGALATEAKRAEDAGADWLHLDVMDGHFVPNITFGPPVVKAIRKATTLPLDVHLMISRPDTYYKQFIEAGADILTIHVESPCDISQTIDEIKKLNCKCGIVFNPDTPFNVDESILRKIDLILFMTVFPGFGGQSFIESVLPKITDATKTLKAMNIDIDIQVDGGIKSQNIKKPVDAGCNVIVAGTSVYGKPDIKMAIEELRNAAENK
ncbi:MAG: ribulose-phosphate 3-epimerase [Candidatus Ancaeobacter aquaticus]|nr:ribulose-phosphate 3-epimerase [Candidatus Ancaeobacter aquaticus]